MDAILFLDVRTLLYTMYQRLQAWGRYRLATHNLRHSFPEATSQQLADNAEGCAICKDVMQVDRIEHWIYVISFKISLYEQY